jgi:hypothetical protein
MRHSIIAVLAATFFASPAHSQSAAPDAAAPKPDPLVATIADCAHQGLEIVMLMTGPDCVARTKGPKKKTSDVPFGIADLDARCKDDNERRKLGPEIIKQVVRYADEQKQPIAPSGIRIIGAIFCDRLDLEGLDLPYSLVLDHSAFAAHLSGRNLKIRSDFSLDGSFLLWGLNLGRARIDGGFYARSSLIASITVADTEIKGSWHQQASLVSGNAIFRGLTLAGDMYFIGTGLTRLSLQASNIRGGLNLVLSEARCTYNIRENRLGFAYAHKFGLGRMERFDDTGEVVAADKPGTDLAWWSKKFPREFTWDAPSLEQKDIKLLNEMLQSPALKSLLKRGLLNIKKGMARAKADGQTNAKVDGCASWGKGDDAEFYFVNNRVDAEVCLSSFGWFEPHDKLKSTIFSLNGTSISGALTLDLWDKPPETKNDLTRNHRLEAFGVSAALFIFDFTDNKHQYAAYLDGLKFNQVYNYESKCIFPSTDADSPTLKHAVTPPSARDVKDLLEKNKAWSLQPFTAFAAAFENVGADASDLRIERKTTELCRKTAQWLPFVSCRYSPAAVKTAAAASPSSAAMTVSPSSVASDFGEVISISFGWLLYGLADHGVRPGKVFWPLLIVMVVFFLLFWYALKIIGFEPKEKEDKHAKPHAPWPLGPLFLFDRLIPLYKIREEHYAVARYFRKATSAEINEAEQGRPRQLRQMRYLWTTWWVSPASDAEKEHAERWLVVLRVVGAVLAVFLGAAIASLTRG